MTVNELFEKLDRQVQNGELKWREAREDILLAHENACTEEGRVVCLGLHKFAFDAVERGNLIAPGHMEDFKKARAKDYKLLLIREAVIGRTDGIIDPVVMRKITDREVAAGRMDADDTFHQLAVAGAEVLGKRPEPPVSRSVALVSAIRSWFR